MNAAIPLPVSGRLALERCDRLEAEEALDFAFLLACASRSLASASSACAVRNAMSSLDSDALDSMCSIVSNPDACCDDCMGVVSGMEISTAAAVAAAASDADEIVRGGCDDVIVKASSDD